MSSLDSGLLRNHRDHEGRALAFMVTLRLLALWQVRDRRWLMQLARRQ